MALFIFHTCNKKKTMNIIIYVYLKLVRRVNLIAFVDLRDNRVSLCNSEVFLFILSEALFNIVNHFWELFVTYYFWKWVLCMTQIVKFFTTKPQRSQLMLYIYLHLIICNRFITSLAFGLNAAFYIVLRIRLTLSMLFFSTSRTNWNYK